MKKRVAKKSTACAAILGAALCFSACGANAGETPNTLILENPASDGTQAQETDAPGENTEPAADEENQAGSAANDAKTDTNVINTEYTVTVIMKSEDDVELTTDDGTVFYTITCSYPIVSIEGNESAAEKINENILSRVSSFNTATNESVEYAKEDFEYMLSEDIQPPMSYNSDLSFTVTRADNDVISFTENGYEYMGGAHGMPYMVGINYDTKTGELISFTDLSDDPDAFHADTLAYNQALAQTKYYSDQLFNTEDITNGTLEETLYADGGWYLSTSGLVFMSPPYALAPYSSGTLEFTIPYSDLANMGFKEQYTYTGKQIIKVLENESYSIDLNGDGNEDSVIYSGEWVVDGPNNNDYITHLTINDVDYSQKGTEDVSDKLIGPWPGLRIYDLEDNDQYMELALIYEEWTHTESDNLTSTKYSRFFRYTEDGTLVYLGQVNGDVSDPSVSVSVSDLESDS